MNKLRWGKFYWSDWADDPALALCSLAAQGLWMRLLCIAAQGTPYGHVTVSGKPPSMADLAKLIRPRPKQEQVERLVAELIRNGVVERDLCGCLVSRRMEHDGRLATARRGAARKRWEDADREPIGSRSDSDRTLFGMPNDRRKAAGKADSGADLHMQKPNFASTESEAKSESESPPYGPPQAGDRRGRVDRNSGGRKPSRNGFVDIALDMMEDRNAEADDARQGGSRVVDLTRHLGSRKSPT